MDSRKKDSGKREIVWLLLIGLIVVILCVSTTSLFLVLKHFTGKRQPQPCYVFDLYGTVQKAKREGNVTEVIKTVRAALDKYQDGPVFVKSVVINDVCKDITQDIIKNIHLHLRTETSPAKK